MTTIAYKHDKKQIAVDSRVSAESMICSDSAKKWYQVDGEFWFIAGSVRDNQILIDSFAGRVQVNYEIDAYGFRVDKDGNVDICQLDEKGNPTICPIAYDYALGTGCEFAISAMDFGRDARQAVEYAKTRDSLTGGKVAVFDIKNRCFYGN